MGAACACPAVAAAQHRDWRGGASLHLDARYGHVDDRDGGETREHLAAVALALRGMAGGRAPVLYAAGLDYQLGASVPAGFLYEVDLLPLGAGLLLTHDTFVAVRGGAGVGETTGHLPFSFQFPAELAVEVEPHRRLRLTVWVRPSWVTHSARRDGSSLLGWADELTTGLALRLGRRYYQHDNRMSAGSGYYVAGLYDEKLGGRALGVAFGHALHVGGGKR